MTAGFGIAHSELSLEIGKKLHGVQLWVALPSDSKDVAPHFAHHNDLPNFNFNDVHIKLFMGEWLGQQSLAQTYSPIIGAEISGDTMTVNLPLKPDFEYGILLDEGEISINGNLVKQNQLHYLPHGSSEITLEAHGNFRAILLGGEPFKEEIVMWWNFIGRLHEEIVAMREDWENYSTRFNSFEDKIGGHIPAPSLPNLRLMPRGSRRGV
jgi:redox-sensitive bicupin YhaK (pirin superfamily)